MDKRLNWKEAYNEALKFYNKYGHLLVSKSYISETGFKLGVWINSQRQKYKGNKTPLTEEQIYLLNSISMVWDASKDCDEEWEKYYAELKKYYMKNGDSMVNQNYVTSDGVKLGAWVSRNREYYKNHLLKNDRVEKLNHLEMVWNTIDFRWQQYYKASKLYYEEHGNLIVRRNYVTSEGLKLGVWIDHQRQRYKGNKSKLSDNQIKLLNDIEMIWDLSKINNGTSFSEWIIKCVAEHSGLGEVLYREKIVCNNIKYELDVYIPSIKLAIEYDGPKHINRCESDNEKNEVCRKLGIILVRIREPELPILPIYTNVKIINLKYKSGTMKSNNEILKIANNLFKCKKSLSLDEMYDEYANFKQHNIQWDKNYKLLINYFNENGNVDIPVEYITVDGYKLGRWVDRVRQSIRGNRNPISKEQINRLENLGFIWKPKEDLWNVGYESAVNYFNKNRNLIVPRNYVDHNGVNLGQWIHNQREAYKGKRSLLTTVKIDKLNAIGMIWDPYSDQWNTNYNLLSQYYDEVGNININRKMKIKGVNLGAWLERQKKSYNDNLLSKEKIIKLEKLNIDWNPRDWDRQWEFWYSLANQYFLENGDLKINQMYKTKDGKNLGKWISKQRSAYFGKGNRKPLNDEQIEKLERIGMVWKVK